MQRLKVYISSFLLAVFTLAVIPAPLLHDIFANHKDQADNHCRFYHKDLGRHVEEKEAHCTVFKADSPLYDVVKITPDLRFSPFLIAEYKTGEIIPYSFSTPFNLPARAPPVF